MKSKSLYVLYAIVLAILPVLLIVMTQLDTPEELLSPPGLYGQNAEIQTAFENLFKDSSTVELQYPSAGDYRSAFVLYDVDGDEQDEAFVFYSLKTDETTVRVNILDKVDDDWISVYDEAGYGAKIIAIDFCDLNKDGQIEVITRWGLYENLASKTLAIQTVTNYGDNLTLNSLVNQSYTYMDIVDMNEDGYDEVLVTWLDNTDATLSKSYASLLSQDEDGKINKLGDSVLLDASVSKYSSLKMQKIDGRTAAFLDAYKGDDTMITEILWWDSKNNSLVAPLLDSATLTNTTTARTPAVASYDINGDGLIEIPIVVTPQNGTQLALFTWAVPNPDGFERVAYGFVNVTLGAFFELPDEMINNIIAYRLEDDGVTTFCWSDDGTTRGDPMFTMVVKKASEFKTEDSYTFKVEHSGYVIYGSLTSAGKDAGFTDEIIENSLIFFDDLT